MACSPAVPRPAQSGGHEPSRARCCDPRRATPDAEHGAQAVGPATQPKRGDDGTADDSLAGPGGRNVCCGLTPEPGAGQAEELDGLGEDGGARGRAEVPPGCGAVKV